MKNKYNPYSDEQKVYQLIECPECHTHQAAISYNTVPFPTFVQHCICCNYTIMESEWKVVSDKIIKPGPLVTGKFIEQVPVYDMPLRALCWNQPYGTMMLHGKQETRRNLTHVEGWVLICTCKKPYGLKTIMNISGLKQMERLRLLYTNDNTKGLNGYAIGVGYLHGSVGFWARDQDAAFVEWKPGDNLWMWEFKHVQRIKPFVWNHGKQGWFKFDFTTDKPELRKLYFEEINKIEII